MGKHKETGTLQCVQLDTTSGVAEILQTGWDCFLSDEFPKNRKMQCLERLSGLRLNTENFRYLLNKLVSQFANEGVYFEVGILCGASLISASLDNPKTLCMGVDNFSLFDHEKFNKGIPNRKSLATNLARFHQRIHVESYEDDFREFIPGFFNANPRLRPTVYFYDGPHSVQDQIDGLEIMTPYLAERCLIAVDDSNWNEVTEANEYFLRQHPDFKKVLEIKTPHNGHPTWWNGLTIISRGI